ncbi:MAG: hypothetical protein ABIE42_10150, partial [Candidatus Eisenbacteria bacterium]
MNCRSESVAAHAVVRTVVCLVVVGLGCFALMAGCATHPTAPFCAGELTREETIPPDAVKQTPETDLYPPVVHSAAFDDPVPLPGPVNTAGSEDAPVVSRDGETLFLFWTPDAQVPAEEQLGDCVTGVWFCERDGRGWTEPERAVLSDDISLDGPMCEQDGTLWFASFRAGGFKEGDIYTATRSGSSWSWRNVGSQLNRDYEIGEVYLTAHGDTMVYARDTSHGVHGQYDLWESYRVSGEWTAPLNLGSTVNSWTYDGWPYLSPNGNELWFTRSLSDLGYPGPAIYRTVRTERGWSEPEEMVSHFAGDSAMDPDGNLYFTHHYMDGAGETIETDIYV